MKKFLLLLMASICLCAHAEDIEADAVLLQALDKTTGRTSFLTVKVGEPYTYADLTIFVKKCLTRPPEETPENSVFLSVSETDGAEIFQGWMFSSDPALSAMEHPVYDIWALECKNTKAIAPGRAEPSVIELDETEVVDVDTLED